MVDNSLALQIQPPQVQAFNPLQAMLIASQLRSADSQNSLAQMQVAEKQTQANALSDYRTRLGANDPKADDALAGTPDLMSKVVQARGQMKEEQRKTLDDNMLRNAQGAQRVLALPPDQRPAAWREELDSALKENRINPLQYERMKATPPDEKLLTPIVKAGLTIEQQIGLEQKEKDRAAGTEFARGMSTLFGGGGQGPAPAAPAGTTPSYFTTLKTVESANNPDAKPINPETGKPASSAGGVVQFLKGTWADLAERYPDLKLTADGRTGKDEDAIAQQERATKAFTADNAGSLIKGDLAPTDRNLYMAHFLGGDGAVKFLKGMAENPNAPATSFVSKDAAEANRSVFFDSAGNPKTALGVYNSLTNKFAGTNTVATGTAMAGSTIAGIPAQKLIPFLAAGASMPGLPKESREVATELLKTALSESKPTDDQREYLQYVKQESDAGRVPKSFFDYKASLKDAGHSKFGVIGKDKDGNDVHGFIDIEKKAVTPVSAQGAVGNAALPAQSDVQLTGEPFLQSLNNPGRANEIKAIADGRMSPPGGMSLKSPQIQSLMRDVAQYEPGFDLTTWKARNDTRTDMAKGKMGQNVTAFNTAIGHLETLDKAADGLGNRWSPAWNAVANMAENATGDPRVKKFEIAKTAVADELTRAFRGTGGNVHDLVQWENAISSSGSPEQLKAAIKQAVELLRSRIEAVGDQYNRGMGKTTDALELLTPKAKAAIQRLSGEAAAKDDASTSSAGLPAPPPGFTLVR